MIFMNTIILTWDHKENVSKGWHPVAVYSIQIALLYWRPSSLPHNDIQAHRACVHGHADLRFLGGTWGTSMSLRYSGPLPWRHLNTSRNTLNRIQLSIVTDLWRPIFENVLTKFLKHAKSCLCQIAHTSG